MYAKIVYTAKKLLGKASILTIYFMWIDRDLNSECAVQIGDFGRKWAKIAQNGRLVGSGVSSNLHQST
jgi:hypothetical protein